MYKETNIIEQKIEEFAEKWIDATGIQSGRVVRVYAEDDEEEMVDTFYMYLLSVDSIPDDIAFYFETTFEDEETYSKLLLEELSVILSDWNDLPKDKDIEFTPVDWRADYSLTDEKNPAYLFVENFNRFAKALMIEEGVLLTAVLKLYTNDARQASSWLKHAIKAGISPLVRITVCDTASQPMFEKLSIEYEDEVVTIIPDMDMGNTMAQLAASGDPNDPATPYRHAFVCLMEAVTKRKKNEVSKYGKECIDIATENVEKNPYWIMQLVVVYTLLSNDQVGYKKYDKALEYAEKAILAAACGEEHLEPGIYRRQVGQTFLFRGSLYCIQKEWKKAMDDYRISAENYGACNDYILQAEALRMQGYAAGKTWTEDSIQPLVDAARLGPLIPPDQIDASSYAYLIKQLLKTNYSSYISRDDLNDMLTKIWGEEWEEHIKLAASPEYSQHTREEEEEEQRQAVMGNY